RTSRISLANRFIIIRLRFITRSGKKFMATDFQSLENPDVLDMSEKGDRACSDNQNGVEGVMHRLLSISGRVIVLAGCGAVLAMLHPLMILAIAALLVVNFLTANRARRLYKQISDALAPVRRKVHYLTETMKDFAYGKDIRLFGMRFFLSEKLALQQKEQYEGAVKTQKIWLTAKGVYATTGMLQELLLYAWLCRQVIAGRITIGDFTMYGAAIRALSSA
ncbi:MAG TPA: ABC transporter ATP-binding protein, partial [Firmicutes bacterium]|nr:ABC transporter ATP-binding protein [Bacillota bacterium]